MSQDAVDGIARITGVSLDISAGDVRAIGLKRRIQICGLFDTPHMTNLGLLLHDYQDDALSPDDIVDKLVDLAPAPRDLCEAGCDKDGCNDWNEFYRHHKKTTLNMIGNARFILKKHGIPHSPAKRGYRPKHS